MLSPEKMGVGGCSAANIKMEIQLHVLLRLQASDPGRQCFTFNTLETFLIIFLSVNYQKAVADLT